VQLGQTEHFCVKGLHGSQAGQVVHSPSLQISHGPQVFVTHSPFIQSEQESHGMQALFAGSHLWQFGQTIGTQLPVELSQMLHGGHFLSTEHFLVKGLHV
jgi:hypothetical protein